MRLIDADALKRKKIRSSERCEWVVPVAEIDWMPTIEPEQKTGKWYDCGSLSCRCNQCGCKNTKETNYCPHCGAKMENGGEDEVN